MREKNISKYKINKQKIIWWFLGVSKNKYYCNIFLGQNNLIKYTIWRFFSNYLYKSTQYLNEYFKNRFTIFLKYNSVI